MLSLTTKTLRSWGANLYVTTFIFAAACTTTPEEKYRNEISGLTDMSLDYIESQWGKPEFNLPKTNGRLVKFAEVLVDEEEPVTEQVTKKLCTAELQLTKDGLVEDWSYTKCRDLNVRSGSKRKAQPTMAAPPEEAEFDLDERKLPGVEDGAADTDDEDEAAGAE